MLGTRPFIGLKGEKVVVTLVSLQAQLHYEIVFVLIPGVGYGAASDCRQLLTVIVSCSWRGVIFFQMQIVYIWNFGDF